jgi:hypothetical protein
VTLFHLCRREARPFVGCGLLWLAKYDVVITILPRRAGHIHSYARIP